MSGTCIIVSPYFPPSTLAGVHRARLLANNLPQAGWTPIVVCVDDRFYEETRDPALAAMVDPAVEIVRVSAVPQRLTRPFGLGEISLRAHISLRQAVFGLLESRKIDAVLITGSPFYPMLMASDIRDRFGVPVICDFQDPWVSAWGETVPKWSKSGLSHRLACLLEPRALRGASHVTTVSHEQARQLAARYPWLDAGAISAVPIGSDPRDFDAVPDVAGGALDGVIDPAKWNLTYPGTIWPGVLNTLEAFLTVLGTWADRVPEVASRVRVNFIGTTAQPDNSSEFRVLPIARRLGVAHMVHEVPQRLPYLTALAALSRSDAGLMLGSEETHYTASKLSLFLMSGRPYISLFHQESDAHRSLVEAGGGVPIGFASAAQIAGRTGEIVAGLERLRTAPASIPPADPAAYREYTAAAVAGRYAAIMDGLSGGRG